MSIVKDVDFIRTVLAFMMTITMMFAIYQIIVAEWTTGIIWLCAALVQMVGLFSDDLRAIKASIATSIIFLVAALICHVVILIILNSWVVGHTKMVHWLDTNYFFRLLRITHIVGIVLSIVLMTIIGFMSHLLTQVLSDKSAGPTSPHDKK
eukprot:NODE_554_length_6117_cov_0.778498.p5 type:complete len:151 gc:universal NODE_554_length_6117_cov_0.778498:5329-5781(+)